MDDKWKWHLIAVVAAGLLQGAAVLLAVFLVVSMLRDCKVRADGDGWHIRINDNTPVPSDNRNGAKP